MTRFSVFRYNSRVDTTSSILLNDAIDDRVHLLDAFDSIPDQMRTGEVLTDEKSLPVILL